VGICVKVGDLNIRVRDYGALGVCNLAEKPRILRSSAERKSKQGEKEQTGSDACQAPCAHSVVPV
jgi:hypothetical protein